MTSSVVNGMVNKDIKMEGKTVIITGANTGIGLATAVDMAKRGARVLMACRNEEKARKAKDIVIEESNSDKVFIKMLDLSSMQSVRQFACDINKNEERVDVLINNAGIMMCPQMKTEDGFEMQFGTNHLGHFLLTNLLLDILKKSAPSRVVTVSSLAHYKFAGGRIYWDNLNLEKNYTPGRAYAQSKLMNVLFSRELGTRLKGTGVTTYCIEPGAVATDLQRHVGTHENPNIMDYLIAFANRWTRWLWRTPEQGAQTQIYCAVAPELANESGKFYSSCKCTSESWDRQRDDYAERLWDISENLVNSKSKA